MATNDRSRSEPLVSAANCVVEVTQGRVVQPARSPFDFGGDDIITNSSVGDNGCCPDLPIGFGIRVTGVKYEPVGGYVLTVPCSF